MSKTKTSKMDGPYVDDTEAGAPESQRAANMRLWDRVCTTDPANTKHVNARGGFTAIDAYSQIQRATEIWGPMGFGWGYHVQCEIDSTGKDTLVIARFELWYVEDGQRSSPIQTFGAAKFDHDGHKKAITDAMTKALSYLGYNADIFQGKGALGYTDNKYIEEQRKASKMSKEPPAPPQDRLVPPEHQEQSTGNERTEKQRKMMYALSARLWGKDGVENGMRDLCEANGCHYKSLTKKDASTIIGELKTLLGEGDKNGSQGNDDVPF